MRSRIFPPPRPFLPKQKFAFCFHPFAAINEAIVNAGLNLTRFCAGSEVKVTHSRGWGRSEVEREEGCPPRQSVQATVESKASTSIVLHTLRTT